MSDVWREGCVEWKSLGMCWRKTPWESDKFVVKLKRRWLCSSSSSSSLLPPPTKMTRFILLKKKEKLSSKLVANPAGGRGLLQSQEHTPKGKCEDKGVFHALLEKRNEWTLKWGIYPEQMGIEFAMGISGTVLRLLSSVPWAPGDELRIEVKDINK